MKRWYIRYSDYYPIEFVEGYFSTEELANKVLDYLNEKSDNDMLVVAADDTDEIYNSFEDWLKDYKK